MEAFNTVIEITGVPGDFNTKNILPVMQQNSKRTNTAISLHTFNSREITIRIELTNGLTFSLYDVAMFVQTFVERNSVMTQMISLEDDNIFAIQLTPTDKENIA